MVDGHCQRITGVWAVRQLGIIQEVFAAMGFPGESPLDKTTG